MPQTYKHPPITEAVIEIKFSQPLEERAVRKAGTRLKPRYLFEEDEKGFEYQFPIGSSPGAPKESWLGLKFSSEDRADATILKPDAFSCSRLAPYLGWDNFGSRAKHDWYEMRERAGFSAVTRVGMRYINRIDVPLDGAPFIMLEQVLKFYPASPPELQAGPINAYAMQVARMPGPSGFSLTLNSASIPSPLVDHAAFVLDIDVYREVELPQNAEAIWSVVEAMRHEKNHVFETCVTDFARKMFNA